jgi:acyl-CoA thioester hydrolase
MPDPHDALWLHEARVRPEWVDYNGHMSEAYYVLIFGEATDAFYDHVGLGEAYRQANKVSVYTLESHIRYLVEAPEGEAVRIATRLLRYDAKRLRVHHTMHRTSDAAVLAATELIAMHVDKQEMRGIPFPAVRLQSIAECVTTKPPPEPAQSRHW